MRDLILIGRFAQLTQLTIKALHIYEVVGLLAIAGVTIAAVNRLVTPLVARYGEQRIAPRSLLLIAAGALATCAAPALWLIAPISVIRTIANGLVFPTLGALCAGAVYDYLMPSAPFWMSAGIFALAACLLLPAPLWVARAARRKPWAEDQPKVGAAPD